MVFGLKNMVLTSKNFFNLPIPRNSQCYMKLKYLKRIVVAVVSLVALAGLCYSLYIMGVVSNPIVIGQSKQPKQKIGKFYENYCYTYKVTPGRNRVKAVVLHHTAHMGYVGEPLKSLTQGTRPTSCHALIDFDGTRYIIARPEQITWHAGYSSLGGRNEVNNFSIGIEFQGNTCLKRLTNKQIESAIDYLLPIIKKYHIPLDNIVTHEQVRAEWLKQHPEKAKANSVPAKPDITAAEHRRFMTALKKRLEK